MKRDLSGRVIVISGASSGIGEASARLLAEAGAEVILLARREEELQRVCKQIGVAGGIAHYYPVDLRDAAAIDACVDQLLQDHPRVDVLINNAGRSIRRLVSESFDRLHDYQRTIQLNYLASVQLTLRLLPGMVERDRGQVINVTSQSTLLIVPRFSAYVASKMALEGFSRTLASEMAGSGIAVTLVHYPLVRTAMSAPTRIYKYLPMLSPEEAAQWMLSAVCKRPARIANRPAEVISVAAAAAPGVTTGLMGRFFKFTAKRLEQREQKSSQQ